jgi:hypothetical protein
VIVDLTRGPDARPSAAAAPVRHDHLLLFNRDEYHALRPAGERVGQRVLRHDRHDPDGRLVGSFVAVLDEPSGIATAGHRAPFAGPDIVRGSEPVAEIQALVEGACASFRAAGARRLSVRLRPASWSPAEPSVLYALLQAGFSVAESAISFAIDLDGGPEAYLARLRSPARRALSHAAGEPYSFDDVTHDGSAWAVAYGILRDNRVGKGRPMSLPLDYTLRLRDAFPGAVRMDLLRHDGVPVAASLRYRVLPGIDVVQYWGDHGHTLARSPMNPLVQHLVQTSHASGARLLDLGISSEDGWPNEGLIRFKRSIGATAEVRLILEREL